MDGGAWWAAVHGVARSQTRLSDFTFTFHFHALEKDMATHSSVLAWGIPGTGEPGGLPSLGSHRVGHDWSNLASTAACYTAQQLCIMQRCGLHTVWVVQWTYLKGSKPLLGSPPPYESRQDAITQKPMTWAPSIAQCSSSPWERFKASGPALTVCLWK